MWLRRLESFTFGPLQTLRYRAFKLFSRSFSCLLHGWGNLVSRCDGSNRETGRYITMRLTVAINLRRIKWAGRTWRNGEMCRAIQFLRIMHSGICFGGICCRHLQDKHPFLCFAVSDSRLLRSIGYLQSTKVHGVISQKTLILITTSVRTINLMHSSGYTNGKWGSTW
jgi:hypothetical protein